MNVEDYLRLGLDKSFLDGGLEAKVNGRHNNEALDALYVPGDRQYHPCPEADPGPDVPRGTVHEFLHWDRTRIYEGTVRDIWVYVPEQLEDTTAPSLMVFLDGDQYLDTNPVIKITGYDPIPSGSVRVTAVLDSLIHAGELPPTVAVFVMPGRETGMTEDEATINRSMEYDNVTPTHARFLVDELLPFVETEIGMRFTQDPSKRLICGISSGGICAFNAAWHDPSAFGRVLSHVGSFVNIRGGHNYPYLIRSTPRKPLRVFLQSGERDLDIIYGNWPLANQQMALALEYAGYEYRYVFGEGGHSLYHGGAIFADSLRWLMD